MIIVIYIYIGSSNANARWEQHIKGDVDSLLHRKMQIKGANAFKFEIIEEIVYVGPDQLLRETILMIKHDTVHNGFNCKYSININNIY